MVSSFTILFPLFFFLIALSKRADSEQVTVLNVVSFAFDFRFGDKPFGGLSGLTYNPIENTYTAISDARFMEKDFYIFDIFKSNDNYNDNMILMNITRSFIMDETGPTFNKDTESIIFIENPINTLNSYYVLSDEGEPNLAIQGDLWLYFLNGTFIRNITNELNPLFVNINNLQRNKGIEGISAIDKQQKYFVYSTESTLINDISACSNPFNRTCLRISVNTLSVNGKENDVSLTELYQLRYDLDEYTVLPIPDDAFKVIGLTEIEIFENNVGTLYALILERGFAVGVGNRVRIYIIDLTLNCDQHDVTPCHSLSDIQCIDILPIKKTLIYEFNQHDLGVPVDNYEILNILYNLNGDGQFYDDKFIIHLVAGTDNNFNPLQNNTHFTFLQWDASDFFVNHRRYRYHALHRLLQLFT